MTPMASDRVPHGERERRPRSGSGSATMAAVAAGVLWLVALEGSPELARWAAPPLASATSHIAAACAQRSRDASAALLCVLLPSHMR